ncbi:hypothetical protein MES5069_90106 [Mesorhizobium escarrei]|uniref:Uncharacterized protein n=1 Tax=Mesorhizobium escarrei TaxID=666018 RepID=A0ABN8KH57_9HYPH|nr:hypothetical protein MES5069_90106 [Mesorhizobium escarrei]
MHLIFARSQKTPFAATFKVPQWV